MKITKKTIWSLVKKSYAETAKDDDIKNKIAYNDIVFSWNIEDIKFCFTIRLSGGKITVTEGGTENPDMIFYNKTIDDFHRGNTEQLTGREMKDADSFRWTGNDKYMRNISTLCKSMRAHYKELAREA